MLLELDPPRRAGAILIGAPIGEMREVLVQWGDPEELNRPFDEGPGLALFNDEIGLLVHGGKDGLVRAVEMGCVPDPAHMQILYRGIDLFSVPALDILAQLREMGIEVDDDDPSSPQVVDLTLTFSRGGECYDLLAADGHCRYFTSVLVAGPGYF